MKPFPYKIYPDSSDLIKSEKESPTFVRRSVFDSLRGKKDTQEPPVSPPTTRGPSMLDRLLGLRRTRRDVNRATATAAIDPRGIAGQAVGLAGQAAMPMIQDIAQQGAATVGSAIANASSGVSISDLERMVHDLGSTPSNGTWVITPGGLARDIHTGLYGIPTSGPSRVVGTMHGIGGGLPSTQMIDIANAARNHIEEMGPAMSDWSERHAGGSYAGSTYIPRGVLDMGRALIAAGISGRINPRQYVEAALKKLSQNKMGPGVLPESKNLSDIVGEISGNQSGMTIHVLPAEIQARAIGAGTPMTHIPSGGSLAGVIQLEPHEDEGKHFQDIQQRLREAIGRSNRSNPVKSIENYEWNAQGPFSEEPIEINHDDPNIFDKIVDHQQRDWRQSPDVKRAESWVQDERNREEEKERIRRRDLNRTSWSKWRRMNLAERAAATGSPAGIYGPDERYARSMNTLLDSNQQLKKILKKMY